MRVLAGPASTLTLCACSIAILLFPRPAFADFTRLQTVERIALLSSLALAPTVAAQSYVRLISPRCRAVPWASLPTMSTMSTLWLASACMTAFDGKEVGGGGARTCCPSNAASRWAKPSTPRRLPWGGGTLHRSDSSQSSGKAKTRGSVRCWMPGNSGGIRDSHQFRSADIGDCPEFRPAAGGLTPPGPRTLAATAMSMPLILRSYSVVGDRARRKQEV